MAYQDPFEADWSPTESIAPSYPRAKTPRTKEDEEDVFSGEWEAVSPETDIEAPKKPKPWVETAAIAPREDVKPVQLQAGMGVIKGGGAGWESGDIMVELAELQHKNMWGATLTEQERSRVAELKAKMPKDADKLKLLEEAMYSAGQLGPMMVKSAKYAAAGAAAGAGVGAGVGALGLGAGALPGAAIGARVGATAGAAASAFELEAGLAFDELLDLTDENGNKLDPEVARAAAMGIGGVNAAIELAQIKTLLKWMPGGQQILRSLGVGAIKKALKNPTLGKMLFKAGKDFGKFAATETLQEVSQETSNIIGEEVSKWYDELDKDKNFRNLIESDPSGSYDLNWKVAKEHAERIGGIARQTALGMGVIGLPGLGTRVYKGARDVKRARTEEGAPQEILTEAEELGYDPTQADTFVETVYGGEATVEDLEAYKKELDPKTPTYKALERAITQLKADESELEEIDLIEDKPRPQTAREDISVSSPDKQEQAAQDERSSILAKAQEEITAQASAFEDYLSQREQEGLVRQEQAAMTVPAQEEIPIQPPTQEETFYPEETAPTTEEGMAATGAPDVFTAEWEPVAPATVAPELAPMLSAVDQAAAEAEKKPTEAQKEAGNYKKGHMTLQGLDITIENARGSVRRGVDKAGKPWQTRMKNPYGYIRRTLDGTGEQLDVFLGSEPATDNVFVVHQVDPKTGKFDEYKVMLGFGDEKAATEAYQANYEPGWKGLGKIEPMKMDQFKAWMKAAKLKPEKKPEEKAEAPKYEGGKTPLVNITDPSAVAENTMKLANIPDGAALAWGDVYGFHKKGNLWYGTGAEKGIPAQMLAQRIADQAKARPPKEAPAKEIEGRPEAKEAWQMTRDEWVKSQVSPEGWGHYQRDKQLQAKGEATTGFAKRWDAKHGVAVMDAAAEGKTVPAEVLKDYPEAAEIRVDREAAAPLMQKPSEMVSKSGRKLSPFPSKPIVGRMAQSRLNATDKWLIEEAIKEAESKGDDYNATIFKGELPIGKKGLPQASRDSANEYLFGREEVRLGEATLETVQVKIEMRALREETGEEITVKKKMPAKEALSSLLAKKKTYENILECLAA